MNVRQASPLSLWSVGSLTLRVPSPEKESEASRLEGSPFLYDSPTLSQAWAICVLKSWGGQQPGVGGGCRDQRLWLWLAVCWAYRRVRNVAYPHSIWHVA